jgi:hypothetical protein
MIPKLISALGLATLLGGCAPAYAVKEDAPVKAEETSPADIDSAKPTQICSFYHALSPQEHLTVKYLASPLTPWDVKAVAEHYSGSSMNQVYAQQAVSDATFTCRGTIDKKRSFHFGILR